MRKLEGGDNRLRESLQRALNGEANRRARLREIIDNDPDPVEADLLREWNMTLQYYSPPPKKLFTDVADRQTYGDMNNIVACSMMERLRFRQVNDPDFDVWEKIDELLASLTSPVETDRVEAVEEFVSWICQAARDEVQDYRQSLAAEERAQLSEDEHPPWMPLECPLDCVTGFTRAQFTELRRRVEEKYPDCKVMITDLFLTINRAEKIAEENGMMEEDNVD